MSTRAIMVALAVVGFGSLLLLLDSMVTSVATSELQMTDARVSQARIVYIFGAIGSAVGLILVGFVDTAAKATGSGNRG